MEKIFTPLTLSLSLFFTIDRPLVQIYFSPQPSAAIKIKDGGHNVRYEISEHSLAKIAPAFRAKGPLISAANQICVKRFIQSKAVQKLTQYKTIRPLN